MKTVTDTYIFNEWDTSQLIEACGDDRERALELAIDEARESRARLWVVPCYWEAVYTTGDDYHERIKVTRTRPASTVHTRNQPGRRGRPILRT